MDRVAVLVDAGYLFKEGTRLVTGIRNAPRGAVWLDHAVCIEFLAAQAEELSGLPLLRIYWYDGTSSGPSPTHLDLARRPNVKVRLGVVNSAGEQKGVDSLIVTDMINLARNRAIADIVLLTGDEDMRVGVQQAQEFGVRVHLMGISPMRENVSDLLSQEADITRELALDQIATFIHERQQEPEPLASDEVLDLDQAVDAAIRDCPGELVERVSGDGWSLPQDVDRYLMRTVSRLLGGKVLDDSEKRTARQQFKAAILERRGVSS